VTLSTAAKRAMFAQETGDVFLILLTINHPDFVQPIRVVNDAQGIQSRDNEYIAFPFHIVLPDDAEDSPPRATLTIDNVSREIIENIRRAGQSEITVKIEIIRHSAPDTVEVSFPQMLLKNVKADSLTVSGDLEVEDLVREPFPAGVFDPAGFPGLF
jgi:hypothetical protein